MYRCHGCDREFVEDEPIIEAALEYHYCSSCITTTTPKQLQLALS